MRRFVNNSRRSTIEQSSPEFEISYYLRLSMSFFRRVQQWASEGDVCQRLEYPQSHQRAPRSCRWLGSCSLSRPVLASLPLRMKGRIFYHSHISKGTSDLELKCTQLLTQFFDSLPSARYDSFCLEL